MKKIKSLVAIMMVALFSANVGAQELPQPSPHASFTQRMGVTDISMDYSRPGVKGRTTFGDLVPYGETWRAGANASTKIEFSTDVMIGGKEVKAGKYALYIVPFETEWTFIISSYVDGWGVDKYTSASDVVRVVGVPQKSEMTESMLYSIDQITNNSCVLSLYWDKVKVGFEITANTNELAKVILAESVKKADGSFSVYNKAASYLLENGGDKKEALDLAIKSTSQQKKFWNLTVLSEAYAANGDVKMAVKTAKEALAMSEEAKYDAYIKRNKANLAEWAK
tara:strand:- start:15635 stop:16477 length:843 start_codon:yes stop_codon:yes gene_type:complete